MIVAGSSFTYDLANELVLTMSQARLFAPRSLVSLLGGGVNARAFQQASLLAAPAGGRRGAYPWPFQGQQPPPGPPVQVVPAGPAPLGTSGK